MDDKMKMAHEWAMKVIGANIRAIDANDLVEKAWIYADKMQAEADKRLKVDLANKSFNNVLNADLSKQMVLEDVTYWQPDWSQAPGWADWWAFDEKGKWFAKQPRIEEDLHVWGVVGHLELAPSFNYQGDWRNSLRSRP